MNVMIDLETMGKGPEAAIIAIGAAAFGPSGIIGDIFYNKVTLDSAMRNGGVVDASTILWWMQQPDAARSEFYHADIEEPRCDIYHIHSALINFRDWLNQFNPDDLKVWGDGATFDLVILASAYRNCGMETPWGYRAERCHRTMKNLFPSVLRPEDVGIGHRAVDDAVYNAQHLVNILRHIETELH